MSDGTSQGLFIVVAIVIFGIFVVLAYILFEDTLSPALANMFTDASETATKRLSSHENILTKELWKDIRSNHPNYPPLATVMKENNREFSRVIIHPDAVTKLFSLYMPFNSTHLTRTDTEGKTVKISLKYRTNAIGHTYRFQLHLPEFGSANTDSGRRMLDTQVFEKEGWQEMSAIIKDFPHDISHADRQSILLLHAGEIGESYIDIQDIRIEILD